MNQVESTPLSSQLSMDFEHGLHFLPPQESFPLTIKQHKRAIKDIVLGDIEQGKDCLIVTGFTSLAQIIDAFGGDLHDDKRVQILFGVEPLVKPRKRWKHSTLPQEIQDYWLEEGISAFKSGAVLQTIQRIKKGQIQIKTLNKLHAKLYVTETHAILGSSNFSFSGLTIQHEANIRVGKLGRSPSEAFQYKSIKAIAEYYWNEANPYSDALIDLLQKILIVVDWQEALARAIADLLEGKYAKEYLKAFEISGIPALWPSQSSGIYQGLQILQQLGSLLVADPTGSGKTKMVGTLQLAIINWLWETGRGAKANTVVVAPPLVLESWKQEFLLLKRALADPISQGILSTPRSFKNKAAKELLKIANVLVMDEAHNYLNETSKRSSAVALHGAEFIILSTATPINKKAEDLLRLIQLMDPDNLGDAELEEFKDLYRKPPKELEENDETIGKLQSYIWQFTLRRTKEDINRLIKKAPDLYLNRLGNKCHYPKQVFQLYKTGEDATDIDIAQQIEKLTERLKGIIYLKTINFPKGRDLSTKERRQAYIQGRINAAKALSRYRVQATLRSSRVATVELIEGNAVALSFVSLPNAPKEGGGLLETLQDMQGNMPTFSPTWDTLPKWLKDRSLFDEACVEEIHVYREIAVLVKSMSNNRELAKANHLIQLMRKHSLVVAFDHTIITLYYLQKLIADKDVNCSVITGNNKGSKQKTLDDFGLGSTSKNEILLCSDAIAEGVNLQAARAVVILDMPSVLRLAEQRIGRIDRLDSPYPSIFIHFPDDNPVFQLRADRNLIRTSNLTRQLMGSNLQLPEEMTSRYEDLIAMSGSDVVEEIKSIRRDQDREWEGVKDAFSEVRRMIEGDEALLTADEYERMMHSNARVRCKLSFVHAERSWAFIAFRSGAHNGCSWLLITEDQQVYTDFTAICYQLRKHLGGTVACPFSQRDLDFFLNLYRQNQRKTLPHKKRRALAVAEQILKRQLAHEKKSQNEEVLNQVKELLTLFQPSWDDAEVDFPAFAMLWIDVFRPRLELLRMTKKGRRFISLEDLPRLEKKQFFSKEQLSYVLQHVSFTGRLENQITACIVGVRQ